MLFSVLLIERDGILALSVLRCSFYLGSYRVTLLYEHPCSYFHSSRTPRRMHYSSLDRLIMPLGARRDVRYGCLYKNGCPAG